MKQITIPTESGKPNGENHITENDIEKGKLRVTLINKQYFPNENCELNIIYGNGIEAVVQFKLGVDDRSHIIQVGRSFMTELNMREGDQLRVTKLGSKKYLFDKI